MTFCLASKGREGIEAFVVFAVPYSELLLLTGTDNAAKPSIPSDGRYTRGVSRPKKPQKVLSRATAPNYCSAMARAP